MRTIVDLLRRGNQELFHSAMIAWLLDPNAEHGLGNAFLKLFADKLAEKGCIDLKEMVSASASSSVTVRTETRSSRSRYDIELTLEDKLVVIENKTKSFGDDAQFSAYEENIPRPILIPLGLCDVSFNRSTRERYKVLTYKDVLFCLSGLLVPSTDFGVLIRHYRQFLERELRALDLVLICYGPGGDSDSSGVVVNAIEQSACTDNDWRFLNLYYLAKFQEYLSSFPEWRDAQWFADKNMQSGVWLANNKDTFSKCYTFAPWIEELCLNLCGKNAKDILWFHVEIYTGALKVGIGAKIGVVQLRCEKTVIGNREFLAGFREIHNLKTGEQYAQKLKNDAGTFLLVQEDLLKPEMCFDRLASKLTGFARGFGNFASP